MKISFQPPRRIARWKWVLGFWAGLVVAVLVAFLARIEPTARPGEVFGRKGHDGYNCRATLPLLPRLQSCLIHG